MSKAQYDLNEKTRAGLKKYTADNDCLSLSQESLKCLEKNQVHRNKCKPFFDAYKECKKKQTAERKQKNFEASGGSMWDDEGGYHLLCFPCDPNSDITQLDEYQKVTKDCEWFVEC